ncbi:MAG: ACP S-malonyltransferase [Bdellovibrionota bacterium]
MQKKLALLFPGQGSQVVGMGKDFYQNFKESSLVFEEASDSIRVNLKKLCFDGPLDALTLTENLQPALFTVEAAMLAALRAHTDLQVMVAAGHSLGEYSAIHACGSLGVSEGARLTRLRGSAMQRAVPPGQGTMAAILGLDENRIQNLCKKASQETSGEIVEPANFNAPGQVVIAGSVDGVQKAADLLKSEPEFKGGKSIPLQVSAPFHCSLMKPAQKEMAAPLGSTKFQRPDFAVIPNVTATPTDSELSFAGLLTDQITQPVRWEQSMGVLRRLGVELALEIGPGKVLTGLHKRIDREMQVISISSVEILKEAFK